MKSLKHYFPNFGTGCVAKVAYLDENVIDTLVEGYAEIKPNKIPMEEDFLFDIASLTKTITAILIYQAVEKKLCSLEDKVTSIDKCFLNLQEVTILDLLSHSKEIWTEGYLGDAKNKEELYQMIFHSYIKSENPKYTDTHYIILGILLETIYHKTYREVVIQNIIRPLHLTHTVFEVSEENKVASCNYQIVDGKEVTNICRIPHDPKAKVAYQYGLTLGHAGIFTTASDFLTILISLVDDKEILLKKDTIAKMFAHNNYDEYLQNQILHYAHMHNIPMVRTSDTMILYNHLRNKIELDDFLISTIKPYNHVSMRYPVAYKEINPIPFATNQETFLFNGYTGPIYLIDIPNQKIILIMINTCHTSNKSREERYQALLQMVQELYEEK